MLKKFLKGRKSNEYEKLKQTKTLFHFFGCACENERSLKSVSSIRFSVSNFVTFDVALLCIPNWNVLNASIQATLAQTGSRLSLPLRSHEILREAGFPLDTTSCLL